MSITENPPTDTAKISASSRSRALDPYLAVARARSGPESNAANTAGDAVVPTRNGRIDQMCTSDRHGDSPGMIHRDYRGAPRPASSLLCMSFLSSVTLNGTLSAWRLFDREGSMELTAWVEELEELLYKGHVRALLQRLEQALWGVSRRGPGTKGKRRLLKQVIGYLEARVKLMDYGRLRGWLTW